MVTSFGFKENPINQCIYIKFNESKLVIFILHVDDILLTNNNKSLFHETKSFLSDNFEMKDLAKHNLF